MPTYDIAGRQVEVRELTVGEIRELITKEESKGLESLDVVGHMLLENASLDDIIQLTNLTTDDLNSMTPSTIEKVVDKCRGVNPHFFELGDRARSAAKSLENAGNNSISPAAL